MKSGDAGFQHGFDDGEEFPRVADGQLEARRLAARAQAVDKVQHFQRREKALCAAETQSSPTITPRVVAISMVTFGQRRRGPAWRPATSSARSS
jgi:hypothetical protein